ncbi:MAG: hypothetical protein LUC41_01950 [Clostridiales bacterium]|nr:hypothetical protein [Clostridiales bacterium]
MTVDIRFCGGCNPHYDRGAFAGRIRDEYPDFQYWYNSPEDTDVVILLCGCSAACARIPEGRGRLGDFVVWNQELWDDLCHFLEQIQCMV